MYNDMMLTFIHLFIHSIKINWMCSVKPHCARNEKGIGYRFFGFFHLSLRGLVEDTDKEISSTMPGLGARTVGIICPGDEEEAHVTCPEEVMVKPELSIDGKPACALGSSKLNPTSLEQGAQT